MAMIQAYTSIGMCLFLIYRKVLRAYLYIKIPKTAAIASHKILNDPYLQNELIANIIYNLREKGLFGINFGFVQVIPEDLQSYVNFIKQTTESLHREGYQVHVTLDPNIFGFKADQTNDNSYYSQLGQVADRLVFLPYTWASADIDSFEQTTNPFLEKYIQYAVTQIPADKILLGYTRIAYDWELPYVEDKSPVTALANYRALALANQSGESAYGIPWIS